MTLKLDPLEVAQLPTEIPVVYTQTLVPNTKAVVPDYTAPLRPPPTLAALKQSLDPLTLLPTKDKAVLGAVCLMQNPLVAIPLLNNLIAAITGILLQAPQSTKQQSVSKLHVRFKQAPSLVLSRKVYLPLIPRTKRPIRTTGSHSLN